MRFGSLSDGIDSFPFLSTGDEVLPQEAKQLHLQPMMEVRECVERKSQTRPFLFFDQQATKQPEEGATERGDH